MENLSIDAILAVSEGMKEDLQRQANQGILRNDLNRSLVALGSMNAVDDLVYRLKIRAGSQLGLPSKFAQRKSAAVARFDRNKQRLDFLRSNKRSAGGG